MFAAGCIVVELLTGYPLFPGEDEGDQMACIIEMFGAPSKKLLESCKRERSFLTTRGVPRYCVQSVDERGVNVVAGGYSKRGRFRGPPLSRDLIAALISAGAREAADDALLVDFLRRCLQVDPDDRITAPDAIRHDWLRRRRVSNHVGGPSATARSSVAKSSHAPFSIDRSGTNMPSSKR